MNSVDVVKQGFEAFSKGDMATLDQLMADDLVWVAEGNGILSGRYEGKQAVFDSWAKIPAETGGTFRQDVVDAFGDEHVVVAVTEVTADRKGQHLDHERGVIVFVLQDGKVTQGRLIPHDGATNDAFWAN